MSDLSERELQLYYFGLYRVLVRFRRTTILGWAIVVAGMASVPLGWNLPYAHGMIDIVLSVGTIVAGLAVVQISVAHLNAYLEMHHAIASSGEAPMLSIFRQMAGEIDEGGWQEAYAAIGKLEAMEIEHGLPPLKNASPFRATSP